ncbi:MAG: hypothetical protein EHM84_03075 [Lysobacterales bacterium]|jgi:hypothetical protein|nr:MAG: hypothetical protein EHM84_03075 [Xanthomonadales bacterium]
MTGPETLTDQLLATPQPGGAFVRTLLWGTLIAGLFDISAAMISVQLRGIPALQAVKGVAAGWLGREAFRGGASVVALGFLTHFLIMGVVVCAFYFASRWLPGLMKHWLWTGPAYGAAVYLVMSFVVVPASAFPGSVASTPAAVLQGVLVHMACVGLPIAFITRRLASAAQFAAEGQ